MSKFANNDMQDFVGAIYGSVRERAISAKIKDGTIAVGIRPLTPEAEAWTQLKAEDDITLMMMPLKYGRKIRDAELDRGEEIVALMKQAKANCEKDRENRVPIPDVNFLATNDNGYAIVYEVIEHYTVHCMYGGRVALEVYVYVSTTNQDAALDALWGPESYIVEWAEDNGDMWTQTHRR
jgi:hypothetical protein